MPARALNFRALGRAFDAKTRRRGPLQWNVPAHPVARSGAVDPEDEPQCFTSTAPGRHVKRYFQRTRVPIVAVQYPMSLGACVRNGSNYFEFPRKRPASPACFVVHPGMVPDSLISRTNGCEFDRRCRAPDERAGS